MTHFICIQIDILKYNLLYLQSGSFQQHLLNYSLIGHATKAADEKDNFLLLIGHFTCRSCYTCAFVMRVGYQRRPWQTRQRSDRLSVKSGMSNSAPTHYETRTHTHTHTNRMRRTKLPSIKVHLAYKHSHFNLFFLSFQ